MNELIFGYLNLGLGVLAGFMLFMIIFFPRYRGSAPPEQTPEWKFTEVVVKPPETLSWQVSLNGRTVAYVPTEQDGLLICQRLAE